MGDWLWLRDALKPGPDPRYPDDESEFHLDPDKLELRYPGNREEYLYDEFSKESPRRDP